MEKSIEKNAKLQLEISVSELAYLIRVLLEIGVITNKSKTQVYAWCVERIQTKKADKISFNALKNKSNIPHNSAIVKVGKLMKQIHLKAFEDQFKYLT